MGGMGGMSDRALLESVKLLQSDEPLARLAAVSRIRALLEEVEAAAVRSAREAGIRRSWDQIAVALGKTRWSVLRQFGPHGVHAIDSPAPAIPTVEAPSVVRVVDAGGEQGPGTELEVFPPEVPGKVLVLLGRLLAARGPGRTAQVSIEVLPGVVRVEVGGNDPALQFMDQLSDRRGRHEGPPARLWFELDLRGASSQMAST